MSIVLTKQEALRQIARLICENGIDVSAVENMLQSIPASQKFDVAVVTDDNGTIERLPLNTGSDMCPIGIYPFKNGPFSNLYIELTEQSSQTRKEAKRRQKGNQRIPPLDFWKSLKPVISELNEAMKQLSGVPLSGSYYAEIPGIPGNSQNAIWTIGKFGDIYPDHQVARTRYTGC